MEEQEIEKIIEEGYYMRHPGWEENEENKKIGGNACLGLCFDRFL